ncbi:fimbria/pilus outer membrane usher protein [Vibrio agarivorans]|uniref:fimbria/pilus outer membrane usher protein n=1 Tax=Vibrio agarivorans TaxID=153622 RepID=UPI0025B55705|nr:fimbria/pilus outer membrane usher protein [Vibrio agarivorans]MDN3661388.1 fimbria/pilus outer membrane usher protein [Vibrio agarivorans]
MWRRNGFYLLVLFWGCSVFASINPFGRAITITSVLRTEQRILGQVEVEIGADGSLTLPTDSTSILLAKVLPDSVIDSFQIQSIDNQLTGQTLEQLGFPIQLDPATFELLIAIPLQANRIYPLSMATSEGKREYTEASPFSGYANLFLSGSRNDVISEGSSGDDTYSQSHRLQSGLNYHAANLTYEAEYLDSDTSEAQYNRASTKLTYDFPSQGTRLTLGDTNPETASFQDGADMLGISISRDFNEIPTRNVRPTATQQFTLARTSDVDVVIDGVVVQRLTLPAGRYNLSDIPLAQGSNDINLVIKDQAGNEETISFSIAVDSDLIKQGEFEYVMSVGAPASYSNGKRDYDGEQLLVNGLVEIGVTPSWTLGLNGQYYDSNYQIGTKLLNAWRFGTTEVVASHSQHGISGSGEALRLGYSSPSELYEEFGIRLDVRYEYYSPTFTQVMIDEVDTSSLNQHYGQVSLSMPLFHYYRAGLNVNYRERYEQDEGYWSIGSSFSGPIVNTRATFGLNLNYTASPSSKDEFDVSATLSYPLGRKHRFVGRYQTNNNLYQLDYSYRNNTGSVGGTSVNATVSHDDSDDLEFDGGIDYTANRFNISFDHDSRFSELDSDLNRVDTTRLELGTAIAFSGSNVAIGRPVGESYAVVSTHNNLSSNKVLLSPSSQGSARAEINHGTNVLLPDLIAYAPQLITYDVEDLPPGYDLGAGLFSVNPTLGQAYHLQIGSDAVLTLIGTLADKQTLVPIPLVAGKAYKPDTPEQSIEFFTNRKGRFAVMGMSAGEWVIELQTNPIKRTVINMVENETMLDQKGTLYVE